MRLLNSKKYLLIFLALALVIFPNFLNVLLMGNWFHAQIGHFHAFVGNYEFIYKFSYILRFFSFIYLFSLLKIGQSKKHISNFLLFLFSSAFVFLPLLHLRLSVELTNQIEGFEIFRTLNLMYVILNNTIGLLILNLIIPSTAYILCFRHLRLVSSFVFLFSIFTIFFFSFNIDTFIPHYLSYSVGVFNIVYIFLVHFFTRRTKIDNSNF